MIYQAEIEIPTRGRGTYDVTSNVQAIVGESGIQAGTCQVFILHTSASLMLCENADPDVMVDMETFMSNLVPDGDPMFVHTAEGPDDMPAHVRSVLTSSDLNVPVMNRRCRLGTWQGIYLWEHRAAPHTRRLVITVSGD